MKKVDSVKFLSSFFMTLILSTGIGQAKPKTLHGAGASFPYPLYSKWFSEYQKDKTTIRFNYKPIGSGGGVRQLIAQTIDFGASDIPLEVEDKKKMKTPVKQIPMVVGAIVLAYNIGVKENLVLDSQVIEKIFLGTIKKWNDSRIQKLNPSITLPDIAIAPVQRADSSGTTAIFTEYLSLVGQSWKNQVGTGKSVRWPSGLKAKGNDGVTNIIKTTPGTIGYIELAYAKNNQLPMANIINKNGVVSAPTQNNISESVKSIMQELAKNQDAELVGSIVNAGEGASYPLTALTYLLIPLTNNQENSNELKQFIIWALDNGAQYAQDLHYSPLPIELVQLVKKELSSIQ